MYFSNTLLPHRLHSSPYNSEMTLASAILFSSMERRKVYLQHQRKNSISIEDVLRVFSDQVTTIRTFFSLLHFSAHLMIAFSPFWVFFSSCARYSHCSTFYLRICMFLEFFVQVHFSTFRIFLTKTRDLCAFSRF